MPGDHGSARRWVDGCRCQACDATATYWRTLYQAAGVEHLLRLKVDLPTGVLHGERRGSNTYGCGCTPCCTASRAYDHRPRPPHRDGALEDTP